MRPKSIKKFGGQRLEIIWADDHVSTYDALYLREHCRCAACRDELTGENLIAPGSIPKDITVQKSEIVGNYALAFVFSDNHGGGIYSFDSLREMCPCSQHSS